MSDVIADIRTGGTFLLNPVGTFPIFTREQFTEEQREIENLAREFVSTKYFQEFRILKNMTRNCRTTLSNRWVS
jgi:hypothetical protein